MNNIDNKILEIFKEDIIKIIISNKANETNEFKKIVINKKIKFYQAEKYTNTQVFHENIDESYLLDFTISNFSDNFKQLNIFTNENEYNVKISKKGKMLYGKSKLKNEIEENLEHNRKKKYILEEGTIIKPLVDMGIFTKDNKIVKSMYSKYKQINRFVEMVDDSIGDINDKQLNIIDFGCGKSYLTFILYHYFTEIKGISVNMIGLDLKEDVIKNCNIAAKKYGYDNLKFELGDINGYKCNCEVDMVISLHACDTATDYALYNAIKWNSKFIFSVPCCQHELNEQISTDNFNILTRYGIVKERICALMTDSIRANLLEYCGYKTQVLEFIDLAHTPKNILIRAQKANVSSKRKKECYDEVIKLSKEFNLNPTLLNLLSKDIK